MDPYVRQEDVGVPSRLGKLSGPPYNAATAPEFGATAGP